MGNNLVYDVDYRLRLHNSKRGATNSLPSNLSQGFFSYPPQRIDRDGPCPLRDLHQTH